ncbi:oligosaccharide flippase family protein [Vibrio cyclitrophicus]|uniref:oligosaccharide flippase family protein n=1 Tax=Vibrio cyclitrophicus TaxID=47951 RepID=UPI00031DD8A0|nr:oligosaccharide flippase family protein [Vibrio cyclitrophicus]OEF29285.1 hypothetical protein OA9_23610 [Vibrio cyclitrophicus 1F97]
MKSDSFSKIYKMVLSNSFAKVIGIAAIPICARLFGSEDFGLLAFYTAIVTVSAPLVTLKYPLAIQLPKNKKIVNNIVVGSMLLTIINSIILTTLIFSVCYLVIDDVSFSKISNIWYIIPLGLLARGGVDIFEQYSLRNKKYKDVNINNIVQSFVSSTLKIFFGLIGVIKLGLILGQVSSFFLISLFYFYQNIKEINFNIKFKYIFLSLKRYRTFPVHRMPSQFVLNLTTQLPFLLIGYIYGENYLGLYTMAATIIATPIQLIATSVGKIYYSEVSRFKREQSFNIRNYTNKFIMILAVMGTAISSILFVTSPYIVPILLGSGWDFTIEIIRVLCFLSISQLIINPIINIYTVFNMNIEFLKINIIRLLLVCCCFVISYVYELDIINFLYLYTLIMTIQYFAVYIKVNKFLKII